MYSFNFINNVILRKISHLRANGPRVSEGDAERECWTVQSSILERIKPIFTIAKPCLGVSYLRLSSRGILKIPWVSSPNHSPLLVLFCHFCAQQPIIPTSSLATDHPTNETVQTHQLPPDPGCLRFLFQLSTTPPRSPQADQSSPIADSVHVVSAPAADTHPDRAGL